MKIHTIKYCDQEYNWQLESLEITSNLTLLVGVSGAGKTQILKSIANLREIANGGSFNGVKWELSFSTQEGDDYKWSGEFETRKADVLTNNQSEQEEKEKFNILNEELFKGKNKIVKRTPSQIKFKGIKTPKLPLDQSITDLLNQEEDVAPVQRELNTILFCNPDYFYDKVYGIDISTWRKYENADLQFLKNSNFILPVKLSIAYRYDKYKIFDKIKQSFLSIFPLVEDLRLEPVSKSDVPINITNLAKDFTMVSIKERGIAEWIPQSRMSSGMFKALMYISQLYLSPEGSVILIDEFENSLGVNCIDAVTEDLLSGSKNIQIIITSHHPYVINNISTKHWKIVTRKGNLVTVKNPEEIGIAKSRQKAFIDLINILDEENESIAI